MKTQTHGSRSRQRINKALDFDNPDAIPVIYNSSTGGLFVHGQALLDLFNQYPPDNAVTFNGIPRPLPEHHDDSGNYDELKTDDWGTTWAHRIYGIAGAVQEYPIDSWEQANSKYTFPPVPKPDSQERQQARCAIQDRKQNGFVIQGWVSIFEKLHALHPMENLLMDLVTEEPPCLAFLDRVESYWHQMIDYFIHTGVDAVIFGDDWGTQHGPMVCPDLFRKHFLPRYQRLMTPLRQAGCRVFFHSCGRLDAILDDLLALGIDAIWPQLPVYDELELAQKCHKAGTTLYLHPDRQHLVPRGTPQEIEQTIARYAKRYHAWGGGGIFYIEIEGDAPFENVKALIESVDRYRWRH